MLNQISSVHLEQSYKEEICYHKNYILIEYNDNYAQKFGPNKFSAYQAITHWSTHYPSDSVNTRYDRERKVSNMAWFSQAA